MTADRDGLWIEVKCRLCLPPRGRPDPLWQSAYSSAGFRTTRRLPLSTRPFASQALMVRLTVWRVVPAISAASCLRAEMRFRCQVLCGVPLAALARAGKSPKPRTTVVRLAGDAQTRPLAGELRGGRIALTCVRASRMLGEFKRASASSSTTNPRPIAPRSTKDRPPSSSRHAAAGTRPS